MQRDTSESKLMNSYWKSEKSGSEKPRLCASAAATKPDRLVEIVQTSFDAGCDLVELRLDHLEEPSTEQLDQIPSNLKNRCILTCRPRSQGGKYQLNEDRRAEFLKTMMEWHPGFIDIELSMLKSQPSLGVSARSNGIKIIASWHDFYGMPPKQDLNSIAKLALASGDYGKIVPTAKRFSDNALVISLYSWADRSKLIAFCMGMDGTVSRFLALLLGSPFAYVAANDEPTAPGQIPVQEFKALLDAL